MEIAPDDAGSSSKDDMPRLLLDLVDGQKRIERMLARCLAMQGQSSSSVIEGVGEEPVESKPEEHCAKRGRALEHSLTRTWTLERAVTKTHTTTSHHTRGTSGRHLRRMTTAEMIDKLEPRGLSEMEESRANTYRRTATSATSGVTLNMASRTLTLDSVSNRRARETWFLHPDSRERLVIDVIALVAIILDSIIVPFEVAWGLPSSGSLLAVKAACLLFWTSDLVLGFFAAYYSKGRLVKTRSQIIRRYFRTWFFPWLLMVSLDAVSFVGFQSSKGSLPPVFSLLRLLRLPSIAIRVSALTGNALLRRVTASPYIVVSVKLVVLVVFILWVSHLSACFWKVVGQDAIEFHYSVNQLNLHESSIAFSYFTAYYLSVNLIVAASSLAHPRTLAEALVTVCGLLFGVIWSSVLIGIIGDTLTEFRIQNRDRLEKVRIFRLYLTQSQKQSRIPHELAESIEAEAARPEENARIVEEQVNLLTNLSPQLSETLRMLVFGPVICTQTFIRACAEISAVWFQTMCAEAFVREVLNPGDFAFKPSQDAEFAYFVYWGCFEYSAPVAALSEFGDGSVTPARASRHISCDIPSCSTVSQCEWVCELALFCGWKHRGTMRASSKAEMLKINGDAFMASLRDDPCLSQLASSYALALCKAIRERADCWASDLALPVAHEEVLHYMEDEPRVEMSQAGVAILEKRARYSIGRLRVQSLFAEVEAGLCDLVVYGKVNAWRDPLKESVVRVVSVVALRVRDSQGRVLAQLGELTWCAADERWKGTMALKLPGCDVRQEAPEVTKDRVLTGPLAQIKDLVTVTGQSIDTEVTTSDKWHILTKCVRRTFSMVIEEDWESKCSCHRVALFTRALSHIVMHDCFQQAFILRDDVQIVANRAVSVPVYAWVEPTDMISSVFVQALNHAWSASDVKVCNLQCISPVERAVP